MRPARTAYQPALFGDGIERGAVIEGPYRYLLWRTWAPAKARVLWAMFNPSTGDHRQDDRTLARCLDFSVSWGFGGFDVVNLYAIQSPQAYVVFDHPDPVGPRNDATIAGAVAHASTVVAAWGQLIGPRFLARVAVVERAVVQAGLTLECLGQTFNGSPKHPLYLKADLPRVPFRRVE
jgi:hypothetical protein